MIESRAMTRNSGLDQPASRSNAVIAEDARDLRFVRAVYADLTGRAPLPDEWAAARGKNRAEFVTALAGSQQFWEAWYEELLFYFLLIDNFRPSTDVFAALPVHLSQRKTDVRNAVRTVVSSQFFNARNPGNDTFVTVVLEQLLGLTVQKEKATLEAGKKMYDGKSVRFLKKKGANQSDLVRIVVEHDQFERFLLARHHQALFGVEANLKELRPAIDRMRADPHQLPAVLAQWLSSQAYEDRLQKLRPKSDRLFVRSLFVDLLGRIPTYQEYRRCRNALLALSDSGPLRNVVIKLVLDSGMAKIALDGAASDFTQRQFRRFLCREPSQEEEAAFVTELKSGSCSPELLVRALLTHWEYQHY